MATMDDLSLEDLSASKAEYSPPVEAIKALCLSSHVTYGYVGNKLVVYVLQAFGIDASTINTVNYSNHCGYPEVVGTKPGPDEMASLWNALHLNQLSDFDIMLSGFLPTASAVATVKVFASILAKRNQVEPGSTFYVLDPVMGDHGTFYVNPDVVPMYRSLMPLCHLLLPNQFELEKLTNCTITDMKSVVDAIHILHRDYNVAHVLVTSPTSVRSSKDHLGRRTSCALVGSTAAADKCPRPFYIMAAYVEANLSGTGDLLAALVTALFQRFIQNKPNVKKITGWVSPDSIPGSELPLARAAWAAVSSVQTVVLKTWQHYRHHCDQVPEGELFSDRHHRILKSMELRIIQNYHAIRYGHSAEEHRPMDVIDETRLKIKKDGDETDGHDDFNDDDDDDDAETDVDADDDLVIIEKNVHE